MIDNIMEWLLTYVLMPMAGLLLILVAIVFLALPFAFMSGWEPPSTIAYKECLADGQKEYVCYSMIYGRSGK